MNEYQKELIKLTVKACQTPIVGYFDDVKKYNISNAEFHVIKHKNDLIISIHGSDDLQDWINNLDYEKIHFDVYSNGPKIHFGFFKHYKLIIDKIVQIVLEYNGNVIITGFSLGGAVASLIVLYLKTHLENKNIKLVIFGSPRVGNYLFSLMMKDVCPEAIRVNCGRDIVPHLPTWCMNYRHFGLCFHFGKPKVRIPFYYSIKDHAITNYRKIIQEI